jgi:prophage maintenance system killer protein
LATEQTRYITYAEAVLIHVVVMRYFGESHFGVDGRSLIESALARPRHAAAYENADLIRQAATLCFGLIKNHPGSLVDEEAGDRNVNTWTLSLP